MTERTVDRDPAGLPMMLRAALPVVPGLNQLPGVRKTGRELPELTLARAAVPIERDRVSAYAQVCDFPLRDEVPLTYPHVVAFGLHMAIMNDPTFPFPAIGTVHVANAITRHAPVRVGDRVDVTARPTALRAHPRGRLFDIATEVRAEGQLVWQETSTFLRRDARAGDPGAAAGHHQPRHEPLAGPADGHTTWRLAGDLGRRYAAVSGDRNPIHLYRLTAKAFGFPRQIAHGMWSMARCLAALEGRLPDAVTAEVEFKKPILLPGAVVFGSRPEDGGYAFALTQPKDGAPHLLGRTRAVTGE